MESWNCNVGLPPLSSNNNPVSATWVNVISLSLPNLIIEPSVPNSKSWLAINVPASEPSIVKNVVSDEPSVPLNIISVSLPWASTVMFPDVVVKVTAASPAVKSSAALDTVSKDNTPLRFVFRNWPLLPSEDCILNFVQLDFNFKF